VTADVTEMDKWVRDELRAARQVGLVDIGAVTVHPTEERLACVVTVRDDIDAATQLRLAVVDLPTRRCDLVALTADSVASPSWSPDGGSLAVLVEADGAHTAWILSAAGLRDAPVVEDRLKGVDGAVETVTWSPDGTRLALIVAGFGAERSDVVGSGTIQAPTAPAPWRPEVSPKPNAGRRLLHVWSPREASVDVLAADLNVWEASWLGPQRLMVLGSPGAHEGSWYAATLSTVDLTGTLRPLFAGEAQLAQPAAAPGGDRWSVLAGPASDRGLLAGQLVVGGATEPFTCDTLDADVTDHRWVDEQRILFIGSRRTQTVAGLVDLASRSTRQLLATTATTGRHQPQLGGITAGGDLVLALERHDSPPALSAVGPDERVTTIVSTGGPGAKHVISRTGRTTTLTWTAADRLEIDGLLTIPEGDGPFPLIVNIHGGPVAAWHDGWLGKDPHTTLLASRGFAVLRPNPRGSSGRGAKFVEAVRGDMGGMDADDITAGVDTLVERGVADPDRIGVTGNSYGGYMAAWLPCVSDRFAAAVARSPVTDWRSQHLTSNLSEFDEVFVGGDPFDPTSAYATRSPLLHHRAIRTPMLLTAGSLDLATPPAQALQLHKALLETGVPTELAIYPLEGHGVRGDDALADQLARMLTWFERHLR
jgi:dipeptidyl aminopeptidase/acylaminoacyl peptidase